MNNKQLKMYNQNGFVLKEFFNKKEHELIFNFGIASTGLKFVKLKEGCLKISNPQVSYLV